ncbi:Putative disease resistance TIR-NBS-LRR class protein, partial [Prunus dulcis]
TAQIHSTLPPNLSFPIPQLLFPSSQTLTSPNLPTFDNLHQLFAVAQCRSPPPSTAVRRPFFQLQDYSPNIRDEIRRAYLQKGPCQPRSYKFPQTNQSGINRRFIAHWFDDHDWLEYSIAKDAAFCLHCYLFKSNFDQVGGDAFTGVGFNNWKKAKERFNLHVGPVGSVHNQAREVAYNLMHQTTHIETIVIKQTSQAHTAYRTCLNASLKCTRALAISCDHDEKVKAVVLENAPGNLKLIAPSIQKDLVNSCAKETIDLILSDVKDRYFSIMVDEARDVSIKEQMAMVLRYVNDKGQIIESFSKLRGQGYDGASNMRGEFNGLKTKILREQPCAFYVHCFAHQLQLALVAVAKKNIDVNSFFTTANSLVNVVGASCKRRDALRAQYQEELVRAFEDDCLITGRGLNQETTLKRAGDTRWNSHYGTLISIISMFPSVVNVLQMIVDDNPNDSSGEAYKLWREIQSFEFVFHLFVMKAILGITNTLSLALQKKDQDIVSAMSLVKTCKENLQLMRDNEFEELVEQASSFCYKHDIIVPTMDEEYVIPGRSRIFIHVIDGQLAELNDRFNEKNFRTFTLGTLGYIILDPPLFQVGVEEYKSHIENLTK